MKRASCESSESGDFHAIDATAPVPMLIVAGRGNSGPGHWQTHVAEGFTGTQRVAQDDWQNPSLTAWSRAIDRAVRACERPPLVVAHSFGCLATAHAAHAHGTPIGATLFVAPADPRRFALSLADLAQPVGHPALMLVSENDPWLAYDDAVALAAAWGIDEINLGPAGHVNVDSGHGHWPFGEAIIALMRERLAVEAPLPAPTARRVAMYRQTRIGA
jgi:predicted alpha/beta hydrolase family esterase